LLKPVQAITRHHYPDPKHVRMLNLLGNLSCGM
jgi:hypothetical protein